MVLNSFYRTPLETAAWNGHHNTQHKISMILKDWWWNSSYL